MRSLISLSLLRPQFGGGVARLSRQLARWGTLGAICTPLRISAPWLGGARVGGSLLVAGGVVASSWESSGEEPPALRPLFPGERLIANLLLANGVVWVGWRFKSLRAAVLEDFFMSGSRNYKNLGHRLVAALLSTYSHAGLIHLACNMMALWSFGVPVIDGLPRGEPRSTVRLSPEGFFAMYTAAGILASLGSSAFERQYGVDRPALGASGSVFAVLTYFVLGHEDSRMLIFFAFPVSAQTGLLGLTAINLALARQSFLVQRGNVSLPRVDGMAHLIGTAVGAVVFYCAHLDDRKRAAPRFMTPAEEAFYVSTFDNILIWGLNATCLSADGTATPATCPAAASHCWCDEAHPETQVWALTMETSLQEQGRRLKARSPAYPTLGYIEYLSAQQYYKAQAALWLNATLSPLMLSVASKGLIDCYRDGCDWQGTEWRQYDLRNPVMRDYYVSNVIGSLIDSPFLDGTFVDSIDWWISACSNWPCTEAEKTDLVEASLTTLDAMLGYAAELGKVISVSSHTSLGGNSDYYLAQTALLAKHGNGIRFWEFFTASSDCLTSLIYETGTLGLPVHVHVDKRTLAPDWVELAVFLLGMGNKSYFSYSGPWNLDSFSVWPEFSAPLGAPLGPAKNTSVVTPTTPWEVLPNQNLVYNLPPQPNASVPGVLHFLGVFASPQPCFAAAQALGDATAATWANGDDKEWARHCWARLDVFDAGTCINGEVVTAPCYAAKEPTTVSAVAAPFNRVDLTWERDFEHVHVTWVASTGNATITLVTRE